MGKEMINEVEFLIKMLEEEWSVSKETKEMVVIDRIEAERFVRSAEWVAEEVRKYISLKGDEVLFEEIMKIMKQSYTLHRIVNKIRKELEIKEIKNDIGLLFDQEEGALFYKYF